jgi:hypothetical protein
LGLKKRAIAYSLKTHALFLASFEIRSTLKCSGRDKAMQIILEVPDSIGERLQQLGDHLPEILVRALQEVPTADATLFQDDRLIIELLASQPSPEEILALRPTPTLQARLSELLERNKAGTLSRQDESELDRYLFLEHLVRLAKAHAYKRLQNAA